MAVTVSNIRTWTEDGNAAAQHGEQRILKIVGLLVPTDDDNVAGGYVAGGVYPNLIAYIPSNYVSVVAFTVTGFAPFTPSIGTGLHRQLRYTAQPIFQFPGNPLGVSVSVAFFDGGTELAEGQGLDDVRAHFPADILNSTWRFEATYSK